MDGGIFLICVIWLFVFNILCLDVMPTTYEEICLSLAVRCGCLFRF